MQPIKPSPLGLRPQARVEAQPPQAALSAKIEGGRRPDEGRVCRGFPFMGYNGKPAPHQSAGGAADSFPLRGSLFSYSAKNAFCTALRTAARPAVKLTPPCR